MFIRGRYLILGLILTMLFSSGVTYGVLKWEGIAADKLGLELSATGDSDFNKLMSTYQTLKSSYYTDVKKDQLLNGAIDGMIKALDDPYSSYMDPEEAQSFHENISSSFEGIGTEIREEEGNIVVESPIKGSPAERAGVKPKDKILKVNGESLIGVKVSEAVKKIRGKKGTKAELTIQREGEPTELTITVIRDTIPLETVTWTMLDDKIGRITMSKFAETTGEEFNKAMKDLKGKGMQGLVLDLRQNPGGLLNIAVDIANQLVPEGKPILQVEYRDGKKEVYRAKGGKNDLPVVVLIDGGSASAAEILAAALKESGNYTLVGEKTFGKGTVQTTHSFDDGSNIKYTTAKWLTPNGNWVHKNGIEPDQKVAMPEYADLPYTDPEKEFKQDMFASEIRTVQSMLEALGYHPGRKDGYFDAKTREAVVAFQRMEGLPDNGIVKGKTTIRMMDLIKQKLEKNDTQLEKAQAVLRQKLP
jgi:carboxyl-terminal processing protease